MATVKQLPSAQAPDGTTIESFTLSLNGVTATVCSVGAAIHELKVPNFADSSGDTDDVVLGYKTPVDLYHSGNDPYLCVIVGRFANRIAEGKLSLDGKSFTKLAINNDPNHLHGGPKGFSSKIWTAAIVEVPEVHDCPSTKGVKFTLVSEDGDENYPGKIEVSATYTLVPTTSAAKLCLQMEGKSLDDEKASPLSLANHSYFNLGGHNNPKGVMDHKISMHSKKYTPVDKYSIPTREVVSVDAGSGVMNWKGGKMISDALVAFGQQEAGLSKEQSEQHVAAASQPGGSTQQFLSATPEPFNYGFDHNYVIEKSGSGLNIAGVVEHAETKRRMVVATDAPGVQLYTANYLNGSNADISKDNTAYGQWQAVCLETQTYPDSVYVNEKEHEEFAKGKCFILHPGGEGYRHRVEYRFESI